MDIYQRRRLVALSAVVGVFVIVVLAVASGGDDEPAPVTDITGATGATGAQGPEPIPRNQYARQADSICSELNAELANVDQTDLAQASGNEARSIAGAVEQLRALPPPADGQSTANRFIRALDAQASELSDRQIAYERDHGEAVATIDANIANFQAEAAAAAEEFGFDVCGNPEATTEGTDETVPVDPAPVEPVPVEPAPVEPAPVEPTDPGADGGDTGGVTPGGDSGGVTP